MSVVELEIPIVPKVVDVVEDQLKTDATVKKLNCLSS